jgi:integrase
MTAAAVNRPLAALRHLLRLARDEWEVLATAPKTRTGKEPQGRIRWLEPDEEARLLAACAESKNAEMLPLVTLANETGARRGELLGLEWSRVDMSRGVIRIEETKSGKRRDVPMRQVVYGVLAGLPAPHEGRVFKTAESSQRVRARRLQGEARRSALVPRSAALVRLVVRHARWPAPDAASDPRPRGHQDDPSIRASRPGLPARRNGNDGAQDVRRAVNARINA